MRELIQQIFTTYGFNEKWRDDDIEFYATSAEDKTSFFLIDYIDASNEGITSTSLLTTMQQPLLPTVPPDRSQSAVPPRYPRLWRS